MSRIDMPSCSRESKIGKEKALSIRFKIFLNKKSIFKTVMLLSVF